MSATFGRIKNIFPFNFIQAFKESWNRSASTELPEGLSWINSSDENGDISIPIIGSTTTAPIWGNSIFKTSSSTEETFNNIRTLNMWLIRAALIFYALFMANKIYKEFINYNNEPE